MEGNEKKKTADNHKLNATKGIHYSSIYVVVAFVEQTIILNFLDEYVENDIYYFLLSFISIIGMVFICSMLIKTARKKIEKRTDFHEIESNKLIECATLLGYLSPVVCVIDWLFGLPITEYLPSKWFFIVAVVVLALVLPFVGREKLGWQWIKFRYGITFICVVLCLISAGLYYFISQYYSKDTIQYDMAFALFTGIVASTIVTLVITIKQEKDSKNKKKAILLDAGFYLNLFDKEYIAFYKALPESIDEKIKELYAICSKPTNYITKLYEKHPELFDLVEINFIRKIISTYNFLNRMLKCDLSDEDIEKYFSAGVSEDSIGIQKYWEMLSTIRDNLYYLKIKWEKDNII